MGDTLTEGQKLEKGGSLTSNNGAYTLTLQDDGNLVLASRGEAVWASGTNGQTWKILTSTNVAKPLANWDVVTNGTFSGVPVNYTNFSITERQRYYRIKSP